ncbi:MAG: hypothetical protein KC643_20005, partial [Nitrospira sp.]|nr:hypothetical protein [Nitrospira sp.]
ILYELYILRDKESLIRFILNTLDDKIENNLISFNEIDLKRKQIRQRWGHDDKTIRERLQPALDHFIHEHPALPFIFETLGREALTVSDVSSQQFFRKLNLYQECFKKVDGHFQLGSILEVHPPFFTAITFNRERRDFTQSHKIYLNLLRPHLVSALHNVTRFSQAQTILNTLKTRIPENGMGAVNISGEGKIKWATAQAHEWLVYYSSDFRPRLDRLPVDIESWVRNRQREIDLGLHGADLLPPLILASSRGTLVGRLMKDQGSWWLFLEERKKQITLKELERYGITPREQEVLKWTVEGKTNPEIGIILGCSPLTVQKHLGSIFVKFGVENRVAAVTRALEISQNYEL